MEKLDLLSLSLSGPNEESDLKLLQSSVLELLAKGGRKELIKRGERGTKTTTGFLFRLIWKVFPLTVQRFGPSTGFSNEGVSLFAHKEPWSGVSCVGGESTEKIKKAHI